MIFKAGCRCDVCGNVEPDPDKMDKFRAFMLPRRGRFPGVGTSKDPKQLATLHVCPPCEPKMKRAFALGKAHMLPTGPLKKIIDKYSMRSLIVQGPRGGHFH